MSPSHVPPFVSSSQEGREEYLKSYVIFFKWYILSVYFSSIWTYSKALFEYSWDSGGCQGGIVYNEIQLLRQCAHMSLKPLRNVFKEAEELPMRYNTDDIKMWSVDAPLLGLWQGCVYIVGKGQLYDTGAHF